MNSFSHRSNPPPQTSVHVEVKGSLDIPLNLGLLSDLGDPLMEQEIIKEAVRIAVSEKLGYFDGMDVRLSSSGGREGVSTKSNGQHHLQQLTESPAASGAAAATTRSYAQRYCEADVDLQRLGTCIVAIQKAYDDLLMQVHLVQEVLNGTGSFASAMHASLRTDAEQQGSSSGPRSSANLFPTDAPSDFHCLSLNGSSGYAARPEVDSPHLEDAIRRLATARQLVDRMLQGRRPDIVSEAAALQDAQQLLHEAAMLEQERSFQGGVGSGDNSNSMSYVDHEDGVDAELRRGLLVDDDEEERRSGIHGTGNEGEHDDNDGADEEELRERYRRAGYCPL
ncbi:hypothetical protein NQL31_003823 [Lotmaria passim]